MLHGCIEGIHIDVKNGALLRRQEYYSAAMTSMVIASDMTGGSWGICK